MWRVPNLKLKNHPIVSTLVLKNYVLAAINIFFSHLGIAGIFYKLLSASCRIVFNVQFFKCYISIYPLSTYTSVSSRVRSSCSTI